MKKRLRCNRFGSRENGALGFGDRGGDRILFFTSYQAEKYSNNCKHENITAYAFHSTCKFKLCFVEILQISALILRKTVVETSATHTSGRLESQVKENWQGRSFLKYQRSKENQQSQGEDNEEEREQIRKRRRKRRRKKRERARCFGSH